MTTTLTAAALECAAAGHPVFPVKPGRKEPLTVHGLHDATTDPEIKAPSADATTTAAPAFQRVRNMV